MRRGNRSIIRHALEIHQVADVPVYLFTLTAGEILQVADISRLTRDQNGELIGYQRREVKKHVQEIADYLNGDRPVFPHPIILALSPSVRFRRKRGPKPSDGFAVAGELELPL